VPDGGPGLEPGARGGRVRLGGGAAPGIKQEATEGGRLGPAGGQRLSKEEAWKLAAKSKKKKKLLKSQVLTTTAAPPSKKGEVKGAAATLKVMKKELNIPSSPQVAEAKKLKKKKVELRRIDRSRTPHKEVAAPDMDPGGGTTCLLCAKEFPKNGPMRRHFEDIHQPGEYPCPGPGCGKVLALSRSLHPPQVFTSKNKMSSHRSRNCNPNKPKSRRNSL
jgi:hypothetical protein